MAADRVKRRLAAVLALDVVGYSRLMGEDEAGTLAALIELRKSIVEPSVAEHDGRVESTPHSFDRESQLKRHLALDGPPLRRCRQQRLAPQFRSFENRKEKPSKQLPGNHRCLSNPFERGQSLRCRYV